MNQVFGSMTGRELLRPFLISAATIAIFIGDMVTDLEIAVSVLYVAIVLMAALFYERRGVILVASTCLALTIINYSLNTRGNPHSGLINTAISLLAVSLRLTLRCKFK